MKRSIYLLSIGLVLFACKGSNSNEAKATDSTAVKADSSTTVYTCPMHPEVTSSKPGECPQCHMQLQVKS